jgi:hypothetical protein
MRQILLLSTGVLIVCLSASVARTASDPEECSSLSGDVNAGGHLDISDAVTILLHLFRDGSMKLPPLCQPPDLSGRVKELEAELKATRAELKAARAELKVVSAELEGTLAELEATRSELASCRALSIRRPGLPATGQTTCYDDLGAEIPCDDPRFPGQDGFHQAGCRPEDRFIDHGDGTVTDLCTGLMWQQDTADTNGDGVVTTEDYRVITRLDDDGVVCWADDGGRSDAYERREALLRGGEEIRRDIWRRAHDLPSLLLVLAVPVRRSGEHVPQPIPREVAQDGPALLVAVEAHDGAAITENARRVIGALECRPRLLRNLAKVALPSVDLREARGIRPISPRSMILRARDVESPCRRT